MSVNLIEFQPRADGAPARKVSPMLSASAIPLGSAWTAYVNDRPQDAPSPKRSRRGVAESRGSTA